MDADMMEAESSVAQSSQVADSSSDQNEVVRNLLSLGRQLIDQGRPSEALEAVLKAMRIKGGEAAARHTLDRARDLYRNKIKESAAADELASLFAECAIEEAMPSNSQTSGNGVVTRSVEVDFRGTSILAETGRKQIVLDAYSDGSSFVCLQCGGLVSNNRRDEHYAFWCCKI